MAKFNRVSDTSFQVYWELAQFHKISSKVGHQHDLNGSTYTCLEHNGELMLVASFTYSPKHSLIELNVSLQGRSAKRNPPKRIVATLEQQSRVMGQNEQGLWTSRPFSYSYCCHYPDGMDTLTKFLKRKEFRPLVPAFNILIEFSTPIVFGNAVFESPAVDGQKVALKEVPEKIQESEQKAVAPAQVTDIEYCTCSKPMVGELQEAVSMAKIGEQRMNFVVCGACGKVVAVPFAEVGTDALEVEEQGEQKVEEQVAEEPKTQVQVPAEPAKVDDNKEANEMHKKAHHERGCVICERERLGLPEPETKKEVFTFNINDSFMLRKKIFK